MTQLESLLLTVIQKINKIETERYFMVFNCYVQIKTSPAMNLVSGEGCQRFVLLLDVDFLFY